MSESIVGFGLTGTFDVNQIGGTDSYFRRLGVELTKQGHAVSFVHYGSKRNSVQNLAPDIPVYYYVSFREAIDHLASSAKHVLVCGIHRHDRIHFIRFRRRQRHNIKFYFLATLFCESRIRRSLHLLETTLYPYNGGTLCMSPRLVKACQATGNKAALILPPVPDYYYASPSEKPNTGHFTVTFVGRPVPGKGGGEAIQILKSLNRKPGIETQVYGYVWPDDREDHSIHNWLVGQNDIRYVEARHKHWSFSLDIELSHVLKNTHILLLPYKWLSSSMDMPLLMLEGMAANCSVLTRPLGDIPLVYGESPCLIRDRDFVRRAVKMIMEMSRNRSLLREERLRIARQVSEWEFSAEEVAAKLIRLFTVSSW